MTGARKYAGRYKLALSVVENELNKIREQHKKNLINLKTRQAAWAKIRTVFRENVQTKSKIDRGRETHLRKLAEEQNTKFVCMKAKSENTKSNLRSIQKDFDKTMTHVSIRMNGWFKLRRLMMQSIEWSEKLFKKSMSVGMCKIFEELQVSGESTRRVHRQLIEADKNNEQEIDELKRLMDDYLKENIIQIEREAMASHGWSKLRAVIMKVHKSKRKKSDLHALSGFIRSESKRFHEIQAKISEKLESSIESTHNLEREKLRLVSRTSGWAALRRFHLQNVYAQRKNSARLSLRNANEIAGLTTKLGDREHTLKIRFEQMKRLRQTTLDMG
eukprot:979414_1